MKLYLAPEPSITLIRYLRSIGGPDGLEGIPTRKRAISDAINTVHALEELDATASRWLEHVGVPVHAYVAERARGTSTKRLVTHLLSNESPYGAFLDIGHGVCICSPRFAFMQMAATIDLIDAVRIGMELCGHYSLWSPQAEQSSMIAHAAAQRADAIAQRADATAHAAAPKASASHLDTQQAGALRFPTQHSNAARFPTRAKRRDCTFDLPSAMRVLRLREFVERNSGLRGARGARGAMRWVLDGSASPMETAVYLLLCLPKRLGGYGFPKPTLNPKIKVSTPQGIKERYPDLFWRGANVDIEYNSDSEHSGEWSRYRDSMREVELTVASIKVLPLTRHQLMDTQEFDAFAQGLRKMLGIRSRPVDLDWLYRRNELRHRLLGSWL